MGQRKFFVILSIAFFALAGLFFGDALQIFVGHAGNTIGSALASPFSMVAGFGRSASLREIAQELTLENEVLKGKISTLEKSSTYASREARVFSTYPFNHQSILMIDKGADAGFDLSWGVTVGDSLLLGKIIEVFPHTSSVQTIFDSDMTLPVKIGPGGIDALFVGGRIPRLTLIAKDAAILPGDEVYSSGSDFPYGLRVGEVLEVIPESHSAFQEASVNIPYDAGSLDAVSVLAL